MTKIIADACCNHLGVRSLIEYMISMAKEIGIDIIKFQSFQADRLNPCYPDFKRWYQYYKHMELSDDDHVFILETCNKADIEPLFTVFDSERTDFLCKIGMTKVKIASPDANNWGLLTKCLDLFADVYISTGMHSEAEIQNLKDWLKKDPIRVKRSKLFYCISKYPTPYNEINFNDMLSYGGFSDHTLGIEAAKKAIDLKVGYIEKHFTLSKDLPGKDHFFSCTLKELSKLVNYRNYIEKCLNYKKRWR